MTNHLKYKFYLRNDQVTTDGNFNIYLYVNISGKKVYLSIGHDIPKKYWIETDQMVRNGFKNTTLINQRIISIKKDLMALIMNSDASGNTITIQRIKDLIKNPKIKGDFIDYIEKKIDQEFKETKINQTTKINYLSLIKHLKVLKGTIKFEDITLNLWNEIEAYFRKDGHSKNTICTRFRFLSSLINRAVKENILEHNPFLGIITKKEKKRREFLMIEEIQLIEEYYKYCLNNRDKYILSAFLFGCYTGLRISDIKNLKLSDIQNNWMYFKIKKTQTDEKYPLNEPALKILKSITPIKGKYFFIPSELNIRLKDLMIKIGINKKITFHCSRHTFATITLLLSRDIATVSKLLGHSKISTTEIYAQIIDESKLNVVNLWNKKTGT
jgi:integrase